VRRILPVGVFSLQSNPAAPALATHFEVSLAAEESMTPTLFDSIIRDSLR
jgi:hypothetical protein